VTALHLAILGVVIVVFPILQSFLKHSRVGTAIRALADNPLLTDVQGMDTNRLYAIIFLIGSSFGGIAAILVSLDIGVRPDMGFDVIFTSGRSSCWYPLRSTTLLCLTSFAERLQLLPA